MRTNIIKYEVDERILNILIIDFFIKNGELPYIFMNRKTIDELLKKQGDIYDNKINGSCHVFENNDLAFGEVEIR